MTKKCLDDPLLTREDAADYIGKSYSFLSKKENRGKFKTIKDGKRIKYFQSSLDAYSNEPLKP